MLNVIYLSHSSNRPTDEPLASVTLTIVQWGQAYYGCGLGTANL